MYVSNFNLYDEIILRRLVALLGFNIGKLNINSLQFDVENVLKINLEEKDKELLAKFIN